MAKRESTHDPMVTANAAGFTTGIVYVACRLFVGFSPGFMLSVAQSWFHTTDLGRVRTPGGVDEFILGLATSVIFAWLVGYLFGWAYTKFSKK